MKKIMFVSAANSIHTVKWVNALSKFYEIHLIYCKNHEEQENKIDKSVILHKLKYSSPFGYYLNSLDIKKIYKKINPDLVNVHYASGYGTLARIAKIPCDLLSIWGSDIYEFPKKSKINYNILKKNLEYATNIESTSDIMANICKKTYPDINKNFFIVPFGVDIQKFKKDITAEKDNNKINLGIVKSLKPVYGIEYAIKTMKILVQKDDRYTLHIYGDGPEKENLQNLINENSLEKNVKLHGKIKNEEVPKVLNKFDVFCATSISESFGVSVVEAMAVGVPVVVSDADGFIEVTNNGETGIIVPKKNEIKLSEEINNLVNNNEKMKELSIKGRKRVEEFYDFYKNVLKMRETYEEIMEKKSEFI